jgi:hypothetical protein
MTKERRNVPGRPVGLWIAMVALFFTLLAWIMQFYSLLDWEGAIRLGLQNESFNSDPVEQALANVERGVALADMFWPLPLTIIALIGLIRKRLYGLVAAMMDFAICIYFPLFFAFQRWDTNPDVALTAIALFAVPSLIGIISLWMNRRLLLN